MCESAREVARLRSEVKRGVTQTADLQLQLASARERGAEEVSRHQETRDEVCMHSLEFENRCLLGVMKAGIYIETPYYNSPWFEGFLLLMDVIFFFSCWF